jgi:hypothetical protein
VPADGAEARWRGRRSGEGSGVESTAAEETQQSAVVALR